MWPFADLSPFAAFGWEARGGYGDAYQTAQAFAVVGARRRRADPAGHHGDRPAARRRPGDRRAAGRRHRDLGGHRRRRHRGVDPTVPGALRHRRADPGGARTDRHDRPPASRSATCPCSPTWCRCSTSGPRWAVTSCSATATCPTSQRPTPTTTSTGPPRSSSTSPSTRSAPASPASPTRRSRGSYAGCYDVTPDWNPVISRTGSTGWWWRPASAGTASRSRPRSGRLVADLVVDGRSADPRIPETDFRLSRFAENDLLKTPYPYVGAGQMR